MVRIHKTRFDALRPLTNRECTVIVSEGDLRQLHLRPIQILRNTNIQEVTIAGKCSWIQEAQARYKHILFERESLREVIGPREVPVQDVSPRINPARPVLSLLGEFTNPSFTL